MLKRICKSPMTYFFLLYMRLVGGPHMVQGRRPLPIYCAATGLISFYCLLYKGFFFFS